MLLRCATWLVVDLVTQIEPFLKIVKHPDVVIVQLVSSTQDYVRSPLAAGSFFCKQISVTTLMSQLPHPQAHLQRFVHNSSINKLKTHYLYKSCIQQLQAQVHAEEVDRRHKESFS
jgi:hypothetical protein